MPLIANGISAVPYAVRLFVQGHDAINHLDAVPGRWHAMVNVPVTKNTYIILGGLRIGRAITI
jgi:hypothetical protein